MASNVDQRYISADAMLADLEEFRKNPCINFDYGDVDLLDSNDEPTQIRKAGDTFHGSGSAAAARQTTGNVQSRGSDGAEHPRRRKSRDDEYDDRYDDYDERRGRSDRGSPIPVFWPWAPSSSSWRELDTSCGSLSWARCSTRTFRSIVLPVCWV